MSQSNQGAAGKGKVFFERADEVAETGNWDFAIELYIEGLKREPDNITRGHQPLREVSMKRKIQGGKPAGMGDKFKHRQGKDHVTNLANASYLLAKDPGNVDYMEHVLKAAQQLEATPAIKWIGEIILETQKQSQRANLRILKLVTDAFHNIEEYGLAIQSCEMARLLNPNDQSLQEAMGDLSAKYTIKKGGYGDQTKDFTEGVKDFGKQRELIEQDRLTQGSAYLHQQVEKTRQEYMSAQSVPGKINAYVEALLKTNKPENENEAIAVLTQAYEQTGAYQFKMKTGDIKIAQMSRKYRECVEAGNTESAKQQLRVQLDFELQEYSERAINYPTDMGLKFELGRRQYLAHKYDDAIASLQQAQRDTRRKIAAMNYLAMSFAAKEWYTEAADTYKKALENDLSEDRSKEIRYNYGEVLLKMNQLEQARHEFSAVAQIDYNYKEVRNRLDFINQQMKS